jgi:hypothetical protein
MGFRSYFLGAIAPGVGGLDATMRCVIRKNTIEKGSSMSKHRVKTRWRGWHHQHGGQRDSTPKVVTQTVKFGHPDWVMQSGRHTGVKISDLPMDFLEWAASKMGWDWAREEIARRYSTLPSPKKSSPPPKPKKETQTRNHSGDYKEGCEYQRLRLEFDRADGDADECPFNTNSYTYTGPSICWVGGQPVIVPSEFPKEAGL